MVYQVPISTVRSGEALFGHRTLHMIFLALLHVIKHCFSITPLNHCIIYRNIAESEIIQLRLRGENFLYLVPDVVQTHLTQIKTTCFIWMKQKCIQILQDTLHQKPQTTIKIIVLTTKHHIYEKVRG